MTTNKGITIDAEHSRDLDDAVWAEHEDGLWKITVTIADVASRVSIGTRMDDTAHARVESRYFANGLTQPMLGRETETKSSLLEGVRRPGMRIVMLLDSGLHRLTLPEVSRVAFVSRQRFAYTDIPAVLDDSTHEFHRPLQLLSVAASALMENRRARGALVLYDLNTGWVTNEDGALHRLKDTRATIGHIIVQEMMILANGELARLCSEHEIPVPWRNHTAKIHAPDRADLMSQINAALATPIAGVELLREHAHMSMNRAEYGSRLRGHYGLNLPGYLHCTSPIRRYADLVTQRQLLAWVRGQPLPYSHEGIARVCDHINARAEALRERDSQIGREQATQRAEKTIRTEDYAALPVKAFERVAKVLARSGSYNAAFAQEFERRMGTSSATIIDLFTVLIEPMQTPELGAWAGLRQAIVDYLGANPHLAVSVAMLCRQMAGWSEIHYEVDRRGPDHAAVHAVKAEVCTPSGETFKSRWATAPSAKVARQRACARVLALGCGLASPEEQGGEL
jgi:ribonuclease R